MNMSLKSSLSRCPMELNVVIDAGIFKYYDPASQKYECLSCSRAGYGDALSHIAGTQHKNAAAWDAINTEDPNPAMLSILSDVIREAKINNEVAAVDKIVFSYQCKICHDKRPFNGLVPLESHLSGGDHLKNKMRCGFAKSTHLGSPPNISSHSEYPSLVPQPSDVNPSSGTGGAIPKHGQFAFIQASKQGKTSSVHLEDSGSHGSHTNPGNIQRSPLAYDRNVSSGYNSASTSYFTNHDYLPPEAKEALSSGDVIEKENTGSGPSYYCKVCCVPLTGVKPLMQHIESAKHIKKISGHQKPMRDTSGRSNEASLGVVHDMAFSNQLSASAVEALKNNDVEGRENGYYCNICYIPLTGPMPLNQHAESEKHRKKVNLKSLPRTGNLEGHFRRMTLSPKVEPVVPDSQIIIARNSMTNTSNSHLSYNTGPSLEEEAYNDGSETDGVMEVEKTPNLIPSNKQSYSNRISPGHRMLECDSVSSVEDPMTTAMSALEKMDCEEDKDRTSDFCQFIASELKKLNPDLCKKAKRKIQYILFEFQDIQDQKSGSYSSDHSLSVSPEVTPSAGQSDYSSSLLSPNDFIGKRNTVPPSSGKHSLKCSDSRERQGASRDSENLKILFTRMGYYARLYEDLSTNQLLTCLREIQKDSRLKVYDSFICIILSHGKDDSTFNTTSGELDLDEVRYHFTNSACPLLKDKPKIFLCNFCRGTMKERQSSIEHDNICYQQIDKSEAPQDMITLYASLKNFSAARHKEQGTIFVQSLCQVLAEHAFDTDFNKLYGLLVTTMQNQEGGTTPELQNYSFKKDFYFNPCNVECL